ncbi:MAG: anti-sigma factor [Hyphomicrobiales bacterium]|nr:MAG: anti-sigma factor [Hyphomicrobiales bacterium]
MTISQHPTEETLTAFASGNLDEGRAVVVAAHVEACSQCRSFVRSLEKAGGVLLGDLAPAEIGSDSLARTLARIERGEGKFVVPPRPAAPPDLPMLPTAARPYPIGRWQWMGPGVRWRAVGVPHKPGARVFLLKAAPGTTMPHHTHTGTELTLVLRGAFTHELGHFGPGDIDEADDTVDHQPVVAKAEECICLVAMEGDLQLLGWMGRLMQPFVRL